MNLYIIFLGNDPQERKKLIEKIVNSKSNDLYIVYDPLELKWQVWSRRLTGLFLKDFMFKGKPLAESIGRTPTSSESANNILLEFARSKYPYYEDITALQKFVFDNLFGHSIDGTTERVLQENILPIIEAGLADSGFSKIFRFEERRSTTIGNNVLCKIVGFEKEDKTAQCLVCDLATDCSRLVDKHIHPITSVLLSLKSLGAGENSPTTLKAFIPVETGYTWPIIGFRIHYRTVSLTLKKVGNAYEVTEAILIDSRSYIVGGFIPQYFEESIKAVFPKCKFSRVFTGHQAPIVDDYNCGRYVSSYVIQLANGITPVKLEDERHSEKDYMGFCSIYSPYNNFGEKRIVLGTVREYKPTDDDTSVLKIVAKKIVFFPAQIFYSLISLVVRRIVCMESINTKDIQNLGDLVSENTGPTKKPVSEQINQGQPNTSVSDQNKMAQPEETVKLGN